ncbi:MAG: polyketide synthase dehydratase domain-containing protein, partial [Myxococcota bacterium]
LQSLESITTYTEHHLAAWSQPCRSLRERWTNAPYAEWNIDPMWLDIPFQLMILWSLQQRQEPCLPVGFSRLYRTQSYNPHMHERFYVHLKTQPANRALLRADAYVYHHTGEPILWIEGIQCVSDASLFEAFQARSLSSEFILHPALNTQK